jgi:hypothetical protein
MYEHVDAIGIPDAAQSVRDANHRQMSTAIIGMLV